jgi:acyl-CoA synthetase (AMP-forming)/AMP-acid ligase II
MNLAATLGRRAAETPEHPAILFEGATITYGELDARTSRLAHALRAHGVGPADRVALYLPNVPDFAVAYFAAQRLGAITVSINAIFKAAEVEYLLNDSGAAVVLTLAELAGFVPRERCPAVRHVVVCDGTPGATPAGTETLDDWLAEVPAQAGAFTAVERRSDDPASLLYSSGTTGFPKGVTLTQHNIATNVATAAAASGFRAEDRLALFLPLFHVYGQNYILNGAVHAGATVALFRRFVPDAVLEAIERDRITMFFGMPTIFIGLLGMDLARRDLSSIRYEMSAASTMPEALRDGWLHSGDIGRMDEDGYVFIVDRVKDMINVSGFKVWPAEVEQYLYRMPGVHECAVYGIPDPVKDEQVAVALVATPGSGLTGQQVIDWCREHLAAYKVPARVDMVAELPKSATGKLLKRVLREQAAIQNASTKD